MPLEVLSVFDAEGRLLYAPLIGEDRTVDATLFLTFLRDRTVTHNHPTGTMLSPQDLIVAIEANMARIEAVCPDGTIMAWERPTEGWPDRNDALQTCRTAFLRASKKAKIGSNARDEIRSSLIEASGIVRCLA